MDANGMVGHTSSRFNHEVQDLFNAVLGMGGRVEKQLQEAANAFHHFDLDKARNVLVMDKRVNVSNGEIENKVTNLLVRQNPAAFDLRLVLSALKTSADLERIGDEACKVAKYVINQQHEGNDCCLNKIGADNLIKMMALAGEMLRNSLDGFARLDNTHTAKMLDDEEVMNGLYDDAFAALKNHVASQEPGSGCALEMAILYRAMERIGDHAVNVIENLFYMLEGKTIRQVSPERLDEIMAQVNR